MSNLPEDTERIISTTDADSTATPDDHKDLPLEKEVLLFLLGLLPEY